MQLWSFKFRRVIAFGCFISSRFPLLHEKKRRLLRMESDYIFWIMQAFHTRSLDGRTSCLPFIYRLLCEQIPLALNSVIEFNLLSQFNSAPVAFGHFIFSKLREEATRQCAFKLTKLEKFIQLSYAKKLDENHDEDINNCSRLQQKSGFCMRNCSAQCEENKASGESQQPYQKQLISSVNMVLRERIRK